MVTANEEDFANFLDFENINFDLDALDAGFQNGQMAGAGNGGAGGDAAMGFGHVGGNPMSGVAQGQPLGQRPAEGHTFHGMDMAGHEHSQHAQPQYLPEHTQGYQGRPMIPPTPDSVEMHGGAMPYHYRQERPNQGMYETYQQKQDDQVRLSLHISRDICTHAFPDDLHTTRFACSDTARESVSPPRVCNG